MASVSSLDQDMRKLRLDRYTPQAEGEVRSWIERSLGEPLASGDLLDALKDGVALCKLANMILPAPGIKFKLSDMPFTQRENISHFLTACERAPLSLPAHDRFLTVDLYDRKDPAQVIQCIGAFSRAANAASPSKFPAVIGPKRQPSPTRKPHPSSPGLAASPGYGVARGTSNASQGSESTVDGARALSPAPTDASGSSRSATGPVSSWSNKSDEFTSAPAWNIHQYGYMGGASQGNQGVSFGARRQIVSPDVNVPSLAEKEKRRREQEAEAERMRLEAEQAERRRRAELEEQERKEKIAEEERWMHETKKAREREKQQVEEERKRWEEDERRWKEEDERRRMEEAENAPPPTGLRGQYLSEYQSEQRKLSSGSNSNAAANAAAAPADSQNTRIKELERQLEEANERERQYQLEREQRSRRDKTPDAIPEPPESSTTYRRPRSISPEKPPEKPPRPDSWAPDEREQLRQEWASHQASSTPTSSRPLPDPVTPSSSKPARASETSPPTNLARVSPPEPPSTTTTAALSSPPNPLQRPLPDPSKPASASPFTRTDRYLARNPAPAPAPPQAHFSPEMGVTAASEGAAEDARRAAAQERTKAGAWASKSLLEREMERERQRQREWEEAQMARPGGSGKLMGPREMK